MASNSLKGMLAPASITLLMKSVRFTIENSTDSPDKAIYIFWHGKMIAGWWTLRQMNPGALVSMSKDGELLSSVLEYWNYSVFRGSSSKGGKEALSKIEQFISEGHSCAITPDGPRGPSGYVKNGALILSNRTGLPIVPLRIEYSNPKILEKSWDRFEIPLPFSDCRITYGKPVVYNELLEGQKLDEFKHSLAKQM